MSTSSKEQYASTLEPPIATPTHGAGGSFTVLAKTFIPHTTPSEVLSTIRDTGTWSHWNGFTPFFTFSSSHSPPPSDLNPNPEPDIPAGKEGWLNLGSQGSMSVYMSGNGLDPAAKKSRMQEMVVTILEPLSSPTSPSSPPSSQNPDKNRTGYRIAWKALGYAHWQLHSERVTELIEINDGDGEAARKGTGYTCWETFGGVLAPVVKLAVGGTLRERFGEYAAGLRGFCVDRTVVEEEQDGDGE
ncbi:hypothetical protein IFR05_003848 [Cadophora sp. M221]|nr:hypothetical protein IFR05_003848 [Cadophora sp. M221]